MALAITLRKIGNDDEAMQLARQALESRQLGLPPDNPRITQSKRFTDGSSGDGKTVEISRMLADGQSLKNVSLIRCEGEETATGWPNCSHSSGAAATGRMPTELPGPDPASTATFRACGTPIGKQSFATRRENQLLILINRVTDRDALFLLDRPNHMFDVAVDAVIGKIVDLKSL